MIIKSSRRGRSNADTANLLEHLLHGAGNEIVVEIGLPGCMSSAMEDARCLPSSIRDTLWHMSVSPQVPLTDAQWRRVEAVIRLAYELGDDLPVTAVEHAKPHRKAIRASLPPRSSHRHFVWPTTDPMTGRRINPWRHYVRNERIARQLEHEFGHPLVKGAHNLAVAKWAIAAGHAELAAAMDDARLFDDGPARQRTSDAERQVAKRRWQNAFAPADSICSALEIARRTTEPAAEFLFQLTQFGFVLAQGSRLVLIPIDGGLQPVAAARKAGTREALLRRYLGAELPRLPRFERTDDVGDWLMEHADLLSSAQVELEASDLSPRP